MIKNIFVPDVIKDYYIISQRIIGFDFNKSVVYATIIKAQGKKRIIERCIEEPLIIDPNVDYKERVSLTIKKILSEAGKIDKVYSAFPSAFAIIKELEIPFKGLHKIKMLLPFEVEPFLPFPLVQATVDCIVINQQPQSTTVAAAAVKNNFLEEHRELFQKAGVIPEKISLDLFELYGLYRSIPPYTHQKGAVGIIDIGLHTTRLLIIIDGVLQGLRTINKGICTLLNNSDMFDNLLRFGFKNFAEENALESFFNEISFSLQAPLNKKDREITYNKILISGFAAQIPHIEETVERFLNTIIEIFNIRKIAHHTMIVVAHNNPLPSSCIISLATALSSPLTQSFNIGTNEPTETDKKLLVTQCIVALLMSIVLCASIGIYSFISLRHLRTAVSEAEQQTLSQLKREFTLPVRKGNMSLDQAIKAAQLDLTKKETIWFSLLPSNSVVKILAELSGRLDREGLGLILRKLNIRTDHKDNDTVSLEGSVKDYDALHHFEEELRQTGYFQTVPKLQDLKFNMILTLKTDRVP